MHTLLKTIHPHHRHKVLLIWNDGGWAAVVEFCDKWGIGDLT
jgi:hypothetical protein